jgi:hypothetical protein
MQMGLEKKTGMDGNIIVYKTRLVAKGFMFKKLTTSSDAEVG